ncbi:hypothetical protein E4U19_000996 [Claviceps sp. Clav32 group G5]|nr:hypothetical protein E4U19_000996 [Claviceps sp. Clav32 group G5]
MESTFDDEKLFSYTDSYLCNHITSIPTPTLAGRAVPLSEKYFAKGYALREDLEDAFKRIRGDWRIFKDILDASGTEWIEDAKCFSLSEVQRAGFIEKYDSRAAKIIDSGLLTDGHITIDTYVNIFSDEPDAGRMIHPAESEVVRGRRGRKTNNANTNANNAMTGELEDETQQPMDLESTPSTTGPPATPNPRETPKPSRKKTSKANEALKTAGTEANAIANARLRDPESQYHLYHQTSKTSVEIFPS